MWKYEDFKGTFRELIAILENEYQLMFYSETDDEYATVLVYAKEATKNEIKNIERWLINIAYEDNRIINIDSNIWVDEYEDDKPEYDDFDVIHDGSYLPD